MNPLSIKSSALMGVILFERRGKAAMRSEENQKQDEQGKEPGHCNQFNIQMSRSQKQEY